jgi:hypothetical protein
MNHFLALTLALTIALMQVIEGNSKLRVGVVRE